MNNRFIEDVCKNIKDKNTKAQIQTELQSHIAEKIDYYIEIGYSEEEATKKATNDMGDAEDISVSLNALHNTKWYKDIKTIIALILSVLSWVISIYITATDNHSFDYYKPEYMIRHNILYDFISVGVFLLVCLGIHYARKNKNIMLAFLTMVFMSATFCCNLFTPFFYLLTTTIDKGLGYYIDNVFIRSYATESLKGYFDFTITAVLCIMVIYIVFIIVGINCHQKMKTTRKFWKPFKIIEKTVSVILAVYIGIMTISTGIAYQKLPDTIKENERLREEAFNIAINNQQTSGNKLYELFEKEGYTIEENPNSFPDEKSYIANYQNISFSFSDKEGFLASAFFKEYPFDDFGVDTEFLEKYKKIMIKDEDYPTGLETWHSENNAISLDKFLKEDKEDIAKNCSAISKVIVSDDSDGEYDDIIIAMYIKNSDKYYTVSFCFSHNFLDSMVLGLKGEDSYENQ